ncbi:MULTISPECIES: lipopolysaccharide biosynthesis protein [unclassified Paenibacillus]|uniref:lipopolysaccharide biosynthesis protein n=1 Tax=unclassified Paenibacillus TaxID=185978 RepID=UPI00311A8CC9
MRMMKKASGKNFSWLFTGNLIYSLSQWGMVVLLAKLGSPAMVGQYVLALSITAPVILFANFQLRDFQATDANNQYSFQQYLTLRLLSMTAVFLLILAVTAFIPLSLNTLLVVWFVCAAKMVESVSDIYFGLFQRNEKMEYVGKSMILKGLSSVLVLGISVYLTQSIAAGALALALAWLGILLFYDMKNGAAVLGIRVAARTANGRLSSFRSVLGRGERATLKGLLLLVLPLGITAALDFLNSSIPRYFLQHIGGEEALGYYSAIAYIMMAGGTFVNAMTQASSPRLSRYFRDNLQGFKRLLLQIMGLCLLLGLAGLSAAYFMGEFLLSLLYSSDYAAYNNVFIIIMLASTIWYMTGCLSAALTVSRYIKLQIPVFLLTCITVLAGSILLIPGYGAAGAAWSICIGMGTRFVCSFALVLHALSRQAALAKQAEQREARIALGDIARG